MRSRFLGAFAGVFVEQALSYAPGFWGYFHQLVGLDPFHGLFEAHVPASSAW
jgi:hypothetical protein